MSWLDRHRALRDRHRAMHELHRRGHHHHHHGGAPWDAWRHDLRRWGWPFRRLRGRLFVWFGVAIGAGVLVGGAVHENSSARFWPVVAVFAVLWMASGVIAWRLTRPLLEVVRAARAIGDGDLTVRIARPHHGELAMLGAAINDMAARLDQQMRDQRQMLAAVSHELRTPLGHMRVLIETARDAGDREGKVLDELEREVIDVDRLVDRLLASSRLDFGTLDRRRIELSGLVTVAMEQAEVPIDRLVVEGDSTAEVDATLIRRAIANLLDNARLHGGGATAVRLERRGGELVCEVDDAGPGVPAAERARVFEPFARAGRGGSLGLGLALVKRIAAVHRGRAWIDDAPGGGARVSFSVRISDDDAT